MEARSREDVYREYVARIGDKDLWLARRDASAICHAISLSLPALSWRCVQARICTVLSRGSRIADRWMLGLKTGGELDFLPVSIDSLEYLLAHGSAPMQAAIRAQVDVSRQIRKAHDIESADLVVGDLYAVLAVGYSADKIRARVTREDARRELEEIERQRNNAVMQAQRQWLSEHNEKRE